MGTFKKLAGDTALYGISTILGRLLNYALVPIQTYAFAKPAAMASNVELYGWIGVLLVVYTLGLETAFFRFIARSKNQPVEEKNRIFNQSLSIVICISVSSSIVLFSLATPITNWLNYPGQERFIQWSALLVAIDAIVAIPFARLRVENRAREFVGAKITNIVIVVALNVFFLIFAKDIYEGKYLTSLQPLADLIYSPKIGPGYTFLANLIGNALYFIIIRKAFSGFQFQLNGSQSRALIVYAFPIMLTNLASVLNLLTDRLFLRHLLPPGFYPGLSSEAVLGIYGNCLKLSVFMALAIQSFKFAADPFFFSQAEDKNAPTLLANVTKWFIIVCVLIWVGVSLNLDLLGQLFLRSKAYRVGLDVVPLLLLGNLLLGVYYNISFWFKLSDKTSYGTLITVIGTGVTIGLNLLLIPIIGYMGCAVAFSISSLVMMVLCYWLGEKYYPVPYHVLSAIGYLLGAGLLIYASWQFPIPNLWVAVPVHMALFGLFLGIVIFVERDTFQPALVRFRNRKNKPAGVNP
ncbi:polysaccharide biosynthesis protein [Spirosoma sp. KCTC 42546]|uniref:polysaccharide biosynthesis C-terminal domain-containing protein n=1 Tax=Spirosoma sp. KCTC 42546 TaxID=2520506 RepID=UPI0011594602|nr:oligosaccharide flippase family protein [Spirosoma sp. KCTC 42546]QDK77115.1 polysaccharide biosynthesis protein [Spirosoma sp. KCTC 42546]